jgi:hypothetical protein
MWTSLVSIATAIVGVAIIATLVSKNANTAGVINAATSGFGYDLGVAVSPVTGGGNLVGGFSNNQLNVNASGF